MKNSFHMLNMLNPLKDTRQFHDSPLRFLVLILSLLPALEGGNIAWGSHLSLKELPPALQRIQEKAQESPAEPKKSQRAPDKRNTTTYIGAPTTTRTSLPASESPIPSTGRLSATMKPHARLGWNYLLNGQPKAAIAAYRQALRVNPKSAKAYLGLGITLKALGSAETAKRALIQAANLNPRLPSALVHLGYLYADGHLGQPDSKRARQLFYQAAQLGDPFAQIALLDLKSRPRL